MTTSKAQFELERKLASIEVNVNDGFLYFNGDSISSNRSGFKPIKAITVLELAMQARERAEALIACADAMDQRLAHAVAVHESIKEKFPGLPPAELMDDGWYRWHGSDTKPPFVTANGVDVVLRNGSMRYGEQIDQLVWKHGNDEFDIVAFRAHIPRKANSWIDWHGQRDSPGGLICSNDTVDIRLRSGEEAFNRKVNALNWRHQNELEDIVAFRQPIGTLTGPRV